MLSLFHVTHVCGNERSESCSILPEVEIFEVNIIRTNMFQ